MTEELTKAVPSDVVLGYTWTDHTGQHRHIGRVPPVTGAYGIEPVGRITAAPTPPAQAANIWTDQRARFERWATKDGAWPDNVARSSESPEEYANSYIQDAWLAVQATSPTPAQPEQADPVLVQHRKPIVGKHGETTGYTSWIDGKGLDWWPHRYLYACPTPAQPAVPEDVADALRDGLSVCRSVSTCRDRKIVRDGVTLYAQTEEWCRWLEDEVGPKIETALEHIDAARAAEKGGECWAGR